MPSSRTRRSERSTHGIGEWYGRSFAQMTWAERHQLAAMQSLPKRQRPMMPCPARCGDTTVPCTKDGGVCSLRLYQQSATGDVSCAPGDPGRLCTTCPSRFYEGNFVFQWIGETILGHADPMIVAEVGFLEREDLADTDAGDRYGREDVGRIDHVLVHPGPRIYLVRRRNASRLFLRRIDGQIFSRYRQYGRRCAAISWRAAPPRLSQQRPKTPHATVADQGADVAPMR